MTVWAHATVAAAPIGIQETAIPPTTDRGRRAEGTQRVDQRTPVIRSRLPCTRPTCLTVPLSRELIYDRFPGRRCLMVNANGQTVVRPEPSALIPGYRSPGVAFGPAIAIALTYAGRDSIRLT
jgi:hypothetical protein